MLIVEVAFLEDNSAFVSYILVITFGEYINEKSPITFMSRWYKKEKYLNLRPRPHVLGFFGN